MLFPIYILLSYETMPYAYCVRFGGNKKHGRKTDFSERGLAPKMGGYIGVSAKTIVFIFSGNIIPHLKNIVLAT